MHNYKEKHSIVNMFLYNKYVHDSDYDSKSLWSKQAGLIIIYNEIQMGGRRNGWGPLKLSTVSVAFFFLPAMTPEVRVAMTGLCLSLILLRGVNRSPSLAMAKRTRGMGNIDPSKL